MSEFSPDTGDQKPVAVVLGVTADIGREMSIRLLKDGWRVVGLGRSGWRVGELLEENDFTYFACDLADKKSVETAINSASQSCNGWTLFLSSAGTMEPIGPFFDTDFDDWEASVSVNSTAQLRVLHGLWPYRKASETVNVMLLAGGGTNNPFTNYSAYCVSKIALIKMCELLDDEEKAANVFIVGPGFVKTRIHQETLQAGDAAGKGFEKTQDFLKTEGTSFDDIYSHMCWCVEAGRDVAGGRNFSTVHDPWRNGGKALTEKLKNHPDAFRLRRRNID